MDPFVRRFIRSSVVWLAIGVLLGVALAWAPGHALVYRPAHMHANLLGFVSMMIFGVAYHVVPRFVGRPLHAPRLAGAHLWIANAGLTLLVGGWLLRGLGGAYDWPLRGGAVLSAFGALAFAFNIWRTLGDGRPAPVRLATGRAAAGAAARATALVPGPNP
jgi:heme/copper-type cytochrome/quinol oxidase subunit 1